MSVFLKLTPVSVFLRKLTSKFDRASFVEALQTGRPWRYSWMILLGFLAFLLFNTRCTTDKEISYTPGMQQTNNVNMTYEDFCADDQLFRRFVDVSSGDQSVVDLDKSCYNYTATWTMFAKTNRLESTQ